MKETHVGYIHVEPSSIDYVNLADRQENLSKRQNWKRQ